MTRRLIGAALACWPCRSNSPYNHPRTECSGFRPPATPGEHFGIASTLGPVCLPLERGLGGRDRLTCTFVAQAMRIDLLPSIRERETDI
jgi:hypothetical protein